MKQRLLILLLVLILVISVQTIKLPMALRLVRGLDCEEGTLCPNGCCPFPNWFCCADGVSCAQTEADC